MASRQEEKQRRREERLERERADKRAAARRKRLQLVVGGVLAVAALAAVIVAVVVAAGGSDGGDEQSSRPQSAARLPTQQTSDYQEAAKAAGCTLANPAYEGAQHFDRAFTAKDYKTNPPTSGPHTPTWYQDGVYAPGATPELGKLVHPLEHGRIEVQYKPGTPKKTVAQLEALLAEQSDGYHMLLFQNTTGMKAQVAATAWTHSLTCPTMNDKVFDAIRTFRARYIDKGPENVP